MEDQSQEQPSVIDQLSQQFNARSNPDTDKIRQICQGGDCPDQFRARIWSVLLNVFRESKSNILKQFTGELDLPEQEHIRRDATQAIETIKGSLGLPTSSLGEAPGEPARFIRTESSTSLDQSQTQNGEQQQQQIASPTRSPPSNDPIDAQTVETIVTFFCKRRGLQYRPEITRIVACLLHVGCDPNTAFNCLYAIVSKHVPYLYSTPRDALMSTCALFRLLLQYHDPALCCHLDQHRCSPETYVFPWLTSLFSHGAVPLSLLPYLWDKVFLTNDLTFTPFVGLAFLRSRRDILLALEGAEIIQALKDTQITEKTELETLLSESERLRANTPISTLSALRGLATAENDTDVSDLCQSIRNSVCLTIPIEDPLLIADVSPFRYIVLDARSLKAFRYARLPTAIHIGSAVREDPRRVVYLIDQYRNVKGSHFALIGSGRGKVEEENFLKFLVMQFVRNSFEHVSLIEVGYRGCVQYVQQKLLELVCDETVTPEMLQRHNERQAAASAPTSAPSPPESPPQTAELQEYESKFPMPPKMAPAAPAQQTATAPTTTPPVHEMDEMERRRYDQSLLLQQQLAQLDKNKSRRMSMKWSTDGFLSKTQSLITKAKEVATTTAKSVATAAAAATASSTSSQSQHQVSQIPSQEPAPQFILDDDIEESPDQQQSTTAIQGDQQPPQQSEETEIEGDHVVNMDDLMEADNIRFFSCKLKEEDGHLDSRYIGVGDTQIISLRPAKKSGRAVIIWQYPLQCLLRITYHKENKNLITFVLKDLSGGPTEPGVEPPKINETFFMVESIQCTEAVRKSIQALKKS